MQHQLSGPENPRVMDKISLAAVASTEQGPELVDGHASHSALSSRMLSAISRQLTPSRKARA